MEDVIGYDPKTETVALFERDRDLRDRQAAVCESIRCLSFNGPTGSKPGPSPIFMIRLRNANVWS